MSVGWLPDNGIIERIKNVIINKGLTEEEFAHAINVPESALKEVFLRGIQSDIIVLVSIIKTYKDISAKWLLTGLGDMGDYKVPVLPKEIYYEKNSDAKMYPASTTKLMTALTVLQNMKTTDIVTIGSEINMIAADSSKAGFSQGQVVTVQELLEGLLISSGNDAAYVLAKAAGEAILKDNIANEGKTFTAAQCVERFVYEMNKNVRDMELENTHFMSPDGYDAADQYTSARDLSKIAIEAYNNETIRKICGTQSEKSGTLNKTWVSTNALLNKSGQFYYQYCVGMKTGSTGLAGKCLVSVAKNGDTECISVVLNDSTDEQRWTDAKKLLKFGVE